MRFELASETGSTGTTSYGTPNASMSRPAVFLDRDGTLMEDPGYVGDPGLVRVLPGVPEDLRRLKNAGFDLVIITNQSGIGRGKFTESDFEAVQRRLLSDLGPDLIDATYMCSDIPGVENSRRKPSPAMLLEAAASRDIDLTRSWMIGDKDIDVQCGIQAGANSILVLTGQSDDAAGRGATYIAKTLTDAVNFILETDAKSSPRPTARP
jgi:D-glycero-D-manno-heptose 1,7-bisphosphate phosphatase